MKAFVLALFISTSALAVDAPILPDQKLTPGSVYPYTKSQVCAGIPRKIVTSVVRKKSFKNYGLTGNHTGYCAVRDGCELDHLIPVLIGGASTVDNLWPQPYSGGINARLKDRLEVRLKKLVCSGKMELETAQREMADDWIGLYNKQYPLNKIKTP